MSVCAPHPSILPMLSIASSSPNKSFHILQLISLAADSLRVSQLPFSFLSFPFSSFPSDCFCLCTVDCLHNLNSALHPFHSVFNPPSCWGHSHSLSQFSILHPNHPIGVFIWIANTRIETGDAQHYLPNIWREDKKKRESKAFLSLDPPISSFSLSPPSLSLSRIVLFASYSSHSRDMI